MKTCPRCASEPAWVLGDGRYKCRACGQRYSFRSVWDSVRLPEPAKRALLGAFVEGLPAYREVAGSDACVDSRERFYRLMRACCVHHGTVSHEALHVAACHPLLFPGERTAMRGWSVTRRVVIIGICAHAGVVQISAPSGHVERILSLLRARSAVSGLVRLADGQGYASLQIEGDYVIVPRVRRAALAMHPVETFWEYARERLQTVRKIPLKYFPLYLGEVCLRFNQRERDLALLLSELARSTAVEDVKPHLAHESSRWSQMLARTREERVASIDSRIAHCEPCSPDSSGARALFPRGRVEMLD